MDKRVKLEEIAALIKPNSLIAFGGGGLQRKPIAAARAIASLDCAPFDVAVMLGGPEVDLLIGAGKVRRLHYSYVGFDRFGLAPHFRAAREGGTLHAVEYSESMMISALSAAAQRLPFMPTRRGLGTDLLSVSNSPFKTFECPVTGEMLVAVPALLPDIAIIHVNKADHAGNGFIVGDTFVDPLLARAARQVFLTCEELIETAPQPVSHDLRISRMWVDGVCELPGGARPTGMYPHYTPDAPSILSYQGQATNSDWFSEFLKGG